jgi:hypothetical protein
MYWSITKDSLILPWDDNIDASIQKVNISNELRCTQHKGRRKALGLIRGELTRDHDPTTIIDDCINAAQDIQARLLIHDSNMEIVEVDINALEAGIGSYLSAAALDLSQDTISRLSYFIGLALSSECVCIDNDIKGLVRKYNRRGYKSITFDQYRSTTEDWCICPHGRKANWPNPNEYRVRNLSDETALVVPLYDSKFIPYKEIDSSVRKSRKYIWYEYRTNSISVDKFHIMKNDLGLLPGEVSSNSI